MFHVKPPVGTTSGDFDLPATGNGRLAGAMS